MHTIVNYVPIDRRCAMARGQRLAARPRGAALFADLAGFTHVTEAIAHALGPQRGAEELQLWLNQIYHALIEQTEHYGGSVVSFAGDALIVWFESRANNLAQAARRAVACGLAMQAAIGPFQLRQLPTGQQLSLALKVSVASGAARRMLVGDPAIQQIEVLAGALMQRLAAVAEQTGPGQVMVEAETGRLLGGLELVVGACDTPTAALVRERVVAEPQPWPTSADGMLSTAQLRPWLLPPVYARLSNGQDAFLAELRYTASLFLRFADLDYDHHAGAAAQLDAFIRWVQGVLARYAGWLIQVSIGDKGSYLYATFGAPIAHGDDVARAGAAALELREVPPELSYIGPPQIGVSGGQSLAGPLGSNTCTYAVLGEATNLAARLMLAAAPGQVLMSARLAPVVSRHYAIAPLAPIHIKGRASPVAVVALLGLQHQAPIGLDEPQHPLPLIGRQAELALAEQQLALAQHGQGQILGIVGAAGIGKSHLVAELLRRASQVGFYSLGGAAQPTTTKLAYYAWQPIWRQLLGLPMAAPGEQASALHQALQALDPALLPRAPLLGTLLGMALPDNELTRPLDAQRRKELLESLLLDCLRAALAAGPGGTPGRPLILVLEDAHWLDPLSLDLLGVIGRALVQLPVLLVLAYRPPEGLATTALPVADLPHFSELRLGELTDDETGELIERKVALLFGQTSQLSRPFTEALSRRAEGNPFYIEELLNYMHDHGIRPGDVATLDQLELTGNLANIILSRIDRLSSQQQVILKVASVIARVFQVDWLWGVHPTLGQGARVRQDLDLLARLDITPLDTPEPNLRYIFKHATLQEVIYESLPFALRARLHGQLAAWLEAQPYEVAPLDLLAYHYGRSNDTAKQREYFRRAGDAAAARFANQAAIHYYERLLPLLPLDERSPILMALGQLCYYTSDWDAAEVHYRAVLALPNTSALLCAQARMHIGRNLVGRWRPAEGLAWLEQAHREFQRLDDRTGMSETAIWSGYAYWKRGDLDQAQALLEANLALEQPNGDLARIAETCHALGNVASSRQDFATASTWWQQSLTLKRELGNRVEMARTLSNLVTAALLSGRLNDARRLGDEAKVHFQAVGARREYGQVCDILAGVAFAQGQLGEARAQVGKNVRLFYELGAQVEFANSALLLAQILVAQDGAATTAWAAVQLIGGVLSTFARAGVALIPHMPPRLESVLQQAHATLGQAASDAAQEQGAAMDWPRMVAYTLQLCTLEHAALGRAAGLPALQASIQPAVVGGTAIHHREETVQRVCSALEHR